MKYLLLVSIVYIVVHEIGKLKRRRSKMGLIQIIKKACKAKTYEELNECYNDLRRVGKRYSPKDLSTTLDIIIILGEKLHRRNTEILSKIEYPCETMDLN